MSHVPSWTFVLTDLAGVALGEVANATERRVVIPLSKPAAAGFKITEQNPHLNHILTKDTLLKCYEGSTLRFHGLGVATEATPGSGGGIEVQYTASDPGFRLVRRISGKSANPTAITADKADIAKQLIDTANAEGDTGIQTQAVSAGSTGIYQPGPYKYTLACINELSDSLDGFDWQIQPQEYASGKIGKFYAAGIVGELKPDVVFEYGSIRSNIRTFSYQRSWDTLANRAFHIPDNGPSDPSGVLSQSNNPSIAARGLYETIVDATNIQDATLRNQLLSEHVGVRGDPRRVVTFTPDFYDAQRVGRVPVFGTDYTVGDQVRVRLAPQGGRIDTFVDGYLRIYQMTIEIDNNGKATYTPTTVDEGPASV